jgi:hypothetical protein
MSGVTVLGETSRHKARERVPRSSTLYLRQRRLGLWEPEGHLHSTVHVDRRRQCGARLLLLAHRGIQCSQTPLAVGLERAHAQRLGQREREQVSR